MTCLFGELRLQSAKEFAKKFAVLYRYNIVKTHLLVHQQHESSTLQGSDINEPSFSAILTRRQTELV